MAKETLKFDLKVDATDATRGLKKFNAQAIDSGKKIGKVWKKVGIAAALTAATAAGAAFLKVSKDIVRTYSNFERELTNVSTLVDTNAVSMKKLKDQILELPATMGSATENTKALYQAISAGVDPAKAVALVGESAKAAKAGLSDTFTAVDAGTTILNSYGKSAEDIVDIFDQMFTAVKAGKTTFEELASSIGKVTPISAAVKVSTQELLSAIAALTKQGLATSESITGLQQIFSNILKPSSQAAEVAEELGIAFNSSALSAKGLSAFLADIVEKTDGSNDALVKLFGSVQAAGAVMALVSKAGFKDFNEIIASMEESSGATEEAFSKQVKTFAATSETLRASLEKIGIIVGAEIVPPLTEAILKLTEWVEQNREFISTTVIDVYKGIGVALTTVKEVAIALEQPFKALVAVLKVLAEVLQLAAKGWQMIFEQMKPVFDFMNKIYDSIAKVIGGYNDFISLSSDTTPEEAGKKLQKVQKGIVGGRQADNKELQKTISLLKKQVPILEKLEEKTFKAYLKETGKSKWKVPWDEKENVISKGLQDHVKKISAILKAEGIKIKMPVIHEAEDLEKFIKKLEKTRKLKIQFTGEGSSELPLGEKIKEMGSMFGQLFTEIGEEKKVAFSFETAAGEALSTAIDTAENSFQSMVSNLIDGTVSVKDAFKDMAVDIVKTLGKMAANKVVSEIFSLIATGIGGAMGGGAGATPYIPALAGGGTAIAGQPHIVGERGPELFIPGKTGTVVPNSDIGGMNFSVVNNINISGSGGGAGGSEADQRNLGRNIAKMVEEQTRQTIFKETRPGGLLNRPAGGVG